MALITVSGFPAAGKSTRVAQLQLFLQEQISSPDYAGPFQKVVVLSDHSLGLSRNVYDDSASEKPARGTLFTALQRLLATDTVLILDSLNYIKGFRYQIYCAAREVKLRTCTVHVVASADQCREWNSQRESKDAYSETTFDNLLMRYEEPSSMVRWDAPLFTILWTDQVIPGQTLWDAITKGNVKPPNAGTVQVSKASSDALQVLEQTTTEMVSEIVAASGSGTGGSAVVSVGNSKLSVALPARTLNVAEMQRMKRQFVSMHKKALTLGKGDGVDFQAENVGRMFAEYVAEHV